MAYDMYQERILEHYRKPRNFGHLGHVDMKGTEANPLCGDSITVELALDASREKVEDVRFHGEGCAISVASASMLSMELKGKTLKELAQLGQKDIEKMVGVPLSPVRIKCALTPLMALGHALGQTSEQ
jgi:nitrogen fixation NifU-like protein